MIAVSEILDDAKSAVGVCSREVLFRRLSDAVEALANKGDWDPLFGYADICVDNGCFVSLPREVETPLAVNIGGRPALGRDQLFTFHLNGPGDEWPISCRYEWLDQGESPVFVEPKCPVKLVGFVMLPEDAGSELWVYGYDRNGTWIRTKIGDDWVNGYRVPLIHGIAVPDSDAPEFSRITRIRKSVTHGPVRLTTLDGTVLGIYDWDETEPIYRRLKLSRPSDWVRLAFRRRTARIRSEHDLIPLHSSLAVLLMLRAIKYYLEDDVGLGAAHEANALRLLIEEQRTRTPPVSNPIQVNDGAALVNRHDFVD